MVTAQIEPFTAGIEELKTLIDAHYTELALNQDKVPLDPRWPVYIDRDAAGEILYITLRDKGRLVGYFIGFIQPGLHYQTCLTCQMDIFYVVPEARGDRNGYRLFKLAELECKRRGVQRMFVGSKLHKDASYLFEKLGYTEVERYYSVWLGE